MVYSSNITFLCTLQKSAVAAGKPAAAAGGTTGRRKSIKKKVGRRRKKYLPFEPKKTIYSYWTLLCCDLCYVMYTFEYAFPG